MSERRREERYLRILCLSGANVSVQVHNKVFMGMYRLWESLGRSSIQLLSWPSVLEALEHWRVGRLRGSVRLNIKTQKINEQVEEAWGSDREAP